MAARDDVDYIMDTFPIVRHKNEQATRDVQHPDGEYRTKNMILRIYDEMAEAMRTGRPYQTRLDPPPADPRVAHPPRERGQAGQAARQHIVKEDSAGWQPAASAEQRAVDGPAHHDDSRHKGPAPKKGAREVPPDGPASRDSLLPPGGADQDVPSAAAGSDGAGPASSGAVAPGSGELDRPKPEPWPQPVLVISPPQGTRAQRLNRLLTIGKQRTPEAIGELVGALGDEDEQLRWLAALALRGLGGGTVIATLKTFIEQAPSAIAREEAGTLLARLEEGAG